MAAAIFFVSGGPLWGPPFFSFCAPKGGVCVVVCMRVLGPTQKSQGYKAPGIFTPV